VLGAVLCIVVVSVFSFFLPHMELDLTVLSSSMTSSARFCARPDPESGTESVGGDHNQDPDTSTPEAPMATNTLSTCVFPRCDGFDGSG